VPTNYWAFAYIEAVYKAGIATGCGNGNYCPANKVTMGQMAAFITRDLLGKNFSYPLDPYFVDVPSTYSLFKYIQRLKFDQITNVSTKFYPDSYLTRGDMAALLTRARQTRLGLNPEKFPFTPDPWFPSEVPSTDSNFKYVQYLVDHNIWLANDPDPGFVTGTYNPGANITEDKMAAFLARAFLKMK